MTTNRKKTRKEPLSWMRTASPDDPIYTRGLKIGVAKIKKCSWSRVDLPWKNKE